MILRFDLQSLLLTGVVASLAAAGCHSPPPEITVAHWNHSYIADPLPGESWGAAGPVLADFDGDNDLDVSVTRRTTQTAYWFENKQGGLVWVLHVMGQDHGLEGALGAVAIDVNRDGLPDMVTNRVWFENPGVLLENRDAPWPAHPHSGTGHDMVAADLNGDDWPDLVANLGGVWLENPTLEPHPIGTVALNEYHGGVAPHGVGDLDGDEDPDVVQPGTWFENPDGAGEWPRHPWPWHGVDRASYGPSIRSFVVDLNEDGSLDIVYSNCDTGHSHLYWVENLGRGAEWKSHPLADPPGSPDTGSFHSLVVADFDLDGDLDIFSGEQEDPDTYMVKDGKLAMKPEGLRERGVVWQNLGPRNDPAFLPVVIHEDNPGWHETVSGDIDGDGDPDLVTKIWNSDVGRWTLNYWRNDNVSAPDRKGGLQ